MHLYPSFQYVQKYGSAFLNSEGGVLLGGVRDDGNCIIFTWVAMVEPDKIISVCLETKLFLYGCSSFCK